MVLISESVANANARIRFFRVAFGLAQTDQRIARSEVQSILTDVTRGGRLQVEWTSDTDLARTEVKLAFLLIQCLEHAMAYGGRVVINSQDGRWQISGQAEKLRIDTALWEVLANPNANPPITPALVQFPLAAEELLTRGFRLKTTLNQRDIQLEF
jgi:histidine phosphotransferase ChpT